MTDQHPVRPPLLFTYRNHRGVVSNRRVLPLSVYQGSSEHHPARQWLMEAYDLDKQLLRTFALLDVVSWDDPHALAGHLSAEAQFNACCWGQEMHDRFTQEAAYEKEIDALKRALEVRDRAPEEVGGLLATLSVAFLTWLFVFFIPIVVLLWFGGGKW